MSAHGRFVRWLKQGESPLARGLARIVRTIIAPTAPRVPEFLKPPLRALYELHFVVVRVARLLLTIFYRSPIFQARCASFGRGVIIDTLPFVHGPVEIHIGNHCYIGGKVIIVSGAMVENPRFVMKDHAEIGWNSVFNASREIVIEEYARVSYDCRVSDTDGHPREADLRAQSLPPHDRDIRPVRIGRYAWVGNGAHIMKGVTIGEGAIIGANSVVISDIPPYALALGNPAEVLFRGYGKPKDRSWIQSSPEQAAETAITANAGK